MLTRRFRLGTYFGIGLFVHWTFGLLLAWVAWYVLSNGGDWWNVAEQIGLMLCVFLCVTLHEYGHALAARAFGISTRDITLLPIGGVAMLERIPRQPIQELIIAIAGPAVNVVIAFLVFVGLVATGTRWEGFDVENFWPIIFWLNLYLVIFNMIPAFPMDGGRVFRSLLAMFLPYGKATRWAGRTGWVLAILIGIAGLYFMQDVRIVLLAMFVLWAGTMEVQQVMWRERVLGMRVGDVMQTRFLSIDQNMSIEEVLRETLNESQREWPVVRDGLYRGMLQGKTLAEAASIGKLDLLASSLHLADIVPLWPEESLEQVAPRGRKFRILPIVDHSYHIVGLLDLDTLASRVEMRRSLPMSSKMENSDVADPFVTESTVSFHS